MRLQEGVRLSTGGTLQHWIFILSWLALLLFESCTAEYTTLQGKESCTLCSSGDKVKFPDASIPYFVLPGAEAPTCSDLAFVSSMVPSDSNLCAKYQTNAGYCGCPEVKPLNNCSFCPNGDIPARSGLLLPTGESCKSLHTYVSFFDDDQCSSLQYKAIVSAAAECGCEIDATTFLQAEVTNFVPDICSLCPDGSFPPDADSFIDMAGLTCGEYAAFINTLDRTQCEIQSNRGTFDLFAFQCKCPGSVPPVCPRQENPELCTVSILETVDDNISCECYSFCSQKFVGCDAYPGNFSSRNECRGTSISGCNYASATDDSESCSICPNFTNEISNPDAILPPFSGVTIPDILEQPTCRDLVDYLKNKSVKDGDCQVAQTRLAHYCGCDGVEPGCTLCPGGIQPSYSTMIATGDATCKEFAGTVLTWEPGTCEIGESYLSVMAGRCGCITARLPICPVQQNPWLCTVNLLRSTDKDCECYNFCGGKFHSCAEFPGQILSASDCPGNDVPVAGCNRALASPTSQRCRRGSIGPPCDVVNDVAKPYLRYLRH